MDKTHDELLELGGKALYENSLFTAPWKELPEHEDNDRRGRYWKYKADYRQEAKLVLEACGVMENDGI